MRNLPPLNALRAFEAAARHASFAKAADELAVTPTAISHQIRLLEDVTGHQLFRRRPRPIALTDAGRKLFPVVRDGLDRFAAAIAQLKADTGQPPLVVSTTTAFAGRWLLPRMAQLRAELGLELEVLASETPADLHAGEADFAIRYRRTPVADCTCRELARDRFIPVASPALIPGGRPLARLADLGDYPLIHFRWKRADRDAPTWERFKAEAQAVAPDAAGLDVTKGLRFSEESHAVEAAISGQGIALVSDLLVQRDLAEGTLIQPVDFRLDGLAYYVVYLADAPYRKSIEDFLLWARDEAAARPLPPAG